MYSVVISSPRMRTGMPGGYGTTCRERRNNNEKWQASSILHNDHTVSAAMRPTRIDDERDLLLSRPSVELFCNGNGIGNGNRSVSSSIPDE